VVFNSIFGELSMIYVGQYIIGKHGESKIKKIELCENVGDKYGIPMKKVHNKDKDRCVFDLENGHFEYGIDCVVSDNFYNNVIVLDNLKIRGEA
tara:strand:- start:260 stop:541 length:282 start_codon:yes stop_codon:yes gene_type:complete